MTVCCPTCGSNVERIDPAKAIGTLHLGPRERRIVEHLLGHFGSFVVTAHLIDVVFSERIDGGPLTATKCLDVAVWQLKPKLRSVGLTIEAGHGRGGGRRLTWATEKARVA